MTHSRIGRLLPILTGFLLLTGLVLALTYSALHLPDSERFDDALLASESILSNGDRFLSKRHLLRSSRYAVSSHQWKQVLSLALRLIPEEAEARDYRFFAVLAGRAASNFPGEEHFFASVAWGLLRSGNTKKAAEYSQHLTDSAWSSLKAEIRLKSVFVASDDSFRELRERLNMNSDPEFFAHTAMLADSAELTFDAALLYAMAARTEEAYKNAEILMAGNRRWADENLFDRRGIAAALAAIAQDAGRVDQAVSWLSTHIETTRKRRALSWEQLQFLGDLHWDRYLLQGGDGERDAAGAAWSEAMDIVRTSSDTASIPEAAWRIWVNTAAMENSRNHSREALELLTEALILFPERPAVMAAWARQQMEENPALVRRMLRQSDWVNKDPMLGITALEADPESLLPRRYEARLWELFDAALGEEGRSVERRVVTSFLLDYMAFRRNYDAIDAAVDRYRRSHPGESWILSWRLAADAVRGMPLINLIPTTSGEPSFYQEFRRTARTEGSWRALHDLALFSLIAARELEAAADGGGLADAPEGSPDDAHAVLLAQVADSANQRRFNNHPMGDRIIRLTQDREDLQDFGKALTANGKRGRDARAFAAHSLAVLAGEIRQEALEDVVLAGSADSLTPENRADLLYLEALVLRENGRMGESMEKAREASNLNPDHLRARQLLGLEENS